jgi:hypothetical protein
MSYGVNDMRDGVNLSRMQVTRPLVMHTEVTNLPNLMGYLRFGRSLPVVRFEDSYNKVASLADAFEERQTAPVRMAVPEPTVSPAPASSRTPAAPEAPSAKRRRAIQPDPSAALPLVAPEEAMDPEIPPAKDEPSPPSPRTAEKGEATDPPPTLELFGKPAGFRLSQHGRHEGARNAARPA